jgi:hypothetical protein
MQQLEEESKGSTSSEEPEYDSDHISDKSIKSDGEAPKIKISYYLSTHLVTERNLTLADITIESYPISKINKLESDLKEEISNLKIKPLLIDPKAEMKRQKEAGDPETLVDYDRIGQLVE